MRSVPRVVLALFVASLVATFAGSTYAQPRGGNNPEIEKLVGEIEGFKNDSFKQIERARVIQQLVALDVPEIVPALLPLLNDVYVHMREETEMAIAGVRGRGRGMQNGETITALIRLGLADREATIRLHTARALGRMGNRDAVRERVGDIAEFISRERDAAVQTALCDAVGQIGVANEDAVKALTRAASKVPAAYIALARLGKLSKVRRFERVIGGRDAEVQIAAIDACVIAGEFLKEAVEAGLAGRQRDYRVRIASTEATPAFYRHSPADALGHVQTALKDDEWRVRAAAVDAILEIWDSSLIGALIDQLAEEKGRLRLDIYYALRLMSGKEFGLEATPWKTWWNANKERFEMPRPPRRGDHGYDRSDLPAGDAASTGASFFDIPVVTTRGMFCFDPSGSMRDPAFDGSEQRKIDYATEHCLQVLEKLPEDAKFDILLYRYYSSFPPETEIQRAFGELVPVNSRSVQKARTFTAGIDPRGWGDFYGAFTAAIADPNVDTVFFLSDGAPSRGEHVEHAELLAQLKKINRFRRVAIHTVLTGRRGADAEFMRNVAMATGGLFKQVDPAANR